MSEQAPAHEEKVTEEVSLSPSQWADVYYFARAVELPEFIARAQKVFAEATWHNEGAK